jgi:hypothetical protein
MKLDERPETLTTYRARNIVTIPTEVVKDLALRIGENFIGDWNTDAGTITLTRAKVIPAEDAWYYTPQVQAAIAESMADLAAGNVETYLTDEEFLDSLAD